MSAPAKPSAATVVVLYGQWLDSLSWSGESASITATPLLAEGQIGAGGYPVLTDSSDKIDVTVRPWTTRPLPSGWWALPLFASDDAEFGKFGGWSVTYGGRTATIAVPEATASITATQNLVDAVTQALNRTDAADPLGLNVNDQVKALWIGDAPTLPAPVFLVPEAVYTARQTTAAIEDRVGDHDEDPQAHPGIRAVLGAITGDSSVGSLAAIASSGSAGDLITGTVPDGRIPNTIARVADLNARLTALVGAAPAALDTLAEIAAQLATDESAASALTTAVAAKVASSDLAGLVRNQLAAALAGSATVTITAAGSGSAQTFTFTSTGGGGTGGIDQSAVAAMFNGTQNGCTVAYNSGTGKLTITVTATAPSLVTLTGQSGTVTMAGTNPLYLLKPSTSATAFALAKPTGTPASNSSIRFMVENGNATDLAVNISSLITNSSLQAMPVTVKANTMAVGSMFYNYTFDRWMLTSLVPETA